MWLNMNCRPLFAVACTGLAANLFFGVSPADAKQCDWRITGKLQVDHTLSQMAAKFGETQPLKNIEVKLSGKEGSALPWGEWDTVRTNGNGEFTVSRNKSCADRYFKVEVKFQDDEIELRHETSTSSLTKVKWYEAWNSANFGNKRPPTVVNLGTLTFGPGAGIAGQSERGDFEVYRHAEMWTVFKMMNDVLEDFGPEYDFERTLIFKYPHNSLVAGAAEHSYFNPITKIGYIHKDADTDDFSLNTMLHEAAHALIYDKFDGEGCLTWDLVLTHDTHDLAPTSCSAFNEGLASAVAERFEVEVFGTTMGLPLNRASMSTGSGLEAPIARPALVERLDEGWYSVFRAMMSPDLGRLKFGSATGTPGRAHAAFFAGTCDEPSVTLEQLLQVLLANGDKGFFRDLTADETRIAPFLSRAAAILADFDEDHSEAVANAHDSRLTGEPSDLLCGISNHGPQRPVGSITQSGQLRLP